MRPSSWISSVATVTRHPTEQYLELQLARLPEGSLIASDTAPLIHWLEGHPRWATVYAALFNGLDAGRWQGLLSTVTHDRDFAGCNGLPILGLPSSNPPNLTSPG